MVRLSYNIYPICLPPPGANFTDKTATVIGWGRTHSEHFSNIAKEANLNIWSNYNCQKIFSRKFGLGAISEQNICAKGTRGVARRA